MKKTPNMLSIFLVLCLVSLSLFLIGFPVPELEPLDLTLTIYTNIGVFYEDTVDGQWYGITRTRTREWNQTNQLYYTSLIGQTITNYTLMYDYEIDRYTNDGRLKYIIE